MTLFLNVKTIILATGFLMASAAASSLRPRKLVVSNDAPLHIDAAAASTTTTIDAAADKRILADDYSCSFFTTKDANSVYQFGFEESSGDIGATSDIGASLDRNILGLAYSHKDGLIYVADGNIAGTQKITTINPNTGETTDVGPQTEMIMALEFVDTDAGTQLWGVQLNSGKIFDVSDGTSTTELHDTGMSTLQNLAWDASFWNIVCR